MASRTSISNRLIDGGRTPVSFPGRAELEVPLTNTLDCINGQGGISLTRASIATFTDFEGVLCTALSGEIRFQGARRVRNGFTYSETLSDASWLKNNSTISLDSQSINGIPVYRLINDATLGTHYTNKNASLTFVAGNKYILSCIAKAGTSNYLQLLVSTGLSTEYVNIDLSNGTATSGNTSQAIITSIGSGFYRVSLLITSVGNGTFGGLFAIINSSNAIRSGSYSGAGEYIYITAAQFEDVTGQSIQTVGEYVSTNVTGRTWKGSGVDGVKYFDTKLDGSKIPYSTMKGVVIEGARTNLFLQSEDLTTTWAPQGLLTVSANQAIGPDGAMTMDKIIPNTVSAFQAISQSVTVTAAVHSISFFAKAGERGYIQVLTSGALSNGYCNFDLINGVVGSSSLFTGSIEAMPNGIYKCSVITDTLIAGTNLIHFNPVGSATTGRAGNIAGDGVGGLYLWGMQIELGALPSSYIPTTTTTVTRPADVLSYNVMNAISNYGAVYLEYTMGFVPSVGMDRRALALTANTVNRFQLVATAPTTNRTSISVGNGTIVMGTDLAIAMSTGSYSKVAGKWTNGGVANLFQNGSKSINLASPSVAVTQIDIGTAGGNPIFGYIKNLKVWKNPPTDSELQALTTL